MCADASGIRPDGAGAARGLGREAGATFLELTLALILGGLGLLGLGYVFGLDYRLWTRSHATIGLHTGATMALERIGRDAGNASGFSAPEANELHLVFPRSPLEDTVKQDIVYRVRDRILYRNDDRLLPWENDTTVGVDSLQSGLETDRLTGTRTLRVQMNLFARLGPDVRADTLRLRTSIHMRNEGLGPASAVSSVSSALPAGGGYP
jgi:hypothetical protein